jgi:hypothetical protein
VRCVRTSVSFARLASSRLAEDESALSLFLVPVVPAVLVAPLPDVPVAVALAGVLASAVAEAADPLPRRSVRSLSIAATSVLQFALAADVGSAAAVADARFSAAM